MRISDWSSDVCSSDLTAMPAEGVAARTRIPTGHKVATRAIAEGAPVVKYDQVIGFATQAIAAGDHVHVHNCGMAEFDRDYAFCEEIGRASCRERVCQYV